MTGRLRRCAGGLAVAATVALSTGCTAGHQGSPLTPASPTMSSRVGTSPDASPGIAQPTETVPAADSTVATEPDNAAALAAVSSDLAAANAAANQASTDLSAGDSARAHNDAAN